MNVLVIGNGAREHALAWKIAQSPLVKQLYVAPGNGGTAAIATNLAISPDDIETLGTTARKMEIDLTVVGPEIPLAEGIIDHFERMKLPVIGPLKSAAQLEASKVFAKQLMKKYGIPAPASETFTDYKKASAYIDTQTPPIVIKANGLAAGKGVIIADSREKALESLSDIMNNRIFGSAGDIIIVDEYLEGKEVSLLAFTDGKTVIPMIPACDYKRVFDGDSGPNTGGMGSYSPPGFFDEKLTEEITDTIIRPTIAAMNKEGNPYKGVLYTGLMLTNKGPRVLEFNVRFGDPETQAILPRLKTDLVEIFLAIIENRLDKVNIEWSNDACVGVVLASGGYPGNYKKGLPIKGLDKLSKDILVFHAGTKIDRDSQILTDGGRVLTVTSTGKSMAEAREKVYNSIPLIQFDGCHYRKDIAAREVN
ncbi:MAG: phosphoribosylamine--glycine ligase [Dehalococcoidia bacterium]